MDAKPGYKSTEFWLTLVGMAAQFLAGVPIPQATLAAAVLGGVYTIGRSVVKAKASNVSLHADDYKQIAATVADTVRALPGRS